MANYNNEKGFTLIELMLIIAIIGILTGMAVLSFRNMYETYKLRGLARYIFSDIQVARINSIKKGKEWIVAWDEDVNGNKYYTVGRKGGTPEKKIFLTGREAIYKIPGLKLCKPDNSNDKPVDVEFNPNGTASSAGIKMSVGDKIYKVYISSTGTGNVKIMNKIELAKKGLATPCP